MILREFFRHDEEDQTRLLKESNTTSPPQYAEFMVRWTRILITSLLIFCSFQKKNKLKDDVDTKRKVFDLASEIGVGKRPRRHE